MNRRQFAGMTMMAAAAAGTVLSAVSTPAEAAQTYRPDFCFGDPCRIEVDESNNALLRFFSKCSAHQAIQSINGISDVQLYAAILQSSRRKEVARLGVQLYNNLDENNVQFSIDADGTIHLISGLSGTKKAQLNTQIQMVIVGTEAPVGTVSIVVD